MSEKKMKGRGRDMASFLTFHFWYLIAAACLWADVAALSGHGIVVWAIGSASAAAAVVLAGFTLRNQVRYHRSAERILRAELVDMARTRAGTADGWLNRDQHLVFTVDRDGPRWLPRWTICRADEDQGRLFDEEPDRVALTADIFGLLASRLQVLHIQDGAVAVAREDGDYDIVNENPVRGFRAKARYVRHFLRTEKTGLLYAGPDELRKLIDQLNEAEPISAAGTAAGQE